MPAPRVQFIHRTTCGMDPAAAACREHWRPHARVPDYESGLGTFDVNYCAKCRMGLTEPYPSEETAGHLYDEKVSGDFDVIQTTPVDRAKDWLARRLLRRIAPGQVARVLDYSCGNARFAALAHDLFPGAQVDAVDYQAAPPPIVASRPRPRLAYYEIGAFRATPHAYDLIVLRHVLEHTHRPVELVRFLGSRLTPRGVLYIEVPNLLSGCARVFGNRWKGYYVPRHLFHYTPESLGQILAAAGLQGEIGRNDMPLMGNMLEILLGVRKSSPVVQGLGAVLHPVQLAIERAYGSSTCLNVKARRPAA